MKWHEKERKLLILYAIRIPEIRERLKVIDPQNLYYFELERRVAPILQAIRDYEAAHGPPPSYAQPLTAQLAKTIQSFPDSDTSGELRILSGWIENAFQVSQQTIEDTASRRLADDLVRNYLYDYHYKGEIRRVLSADIDPDRAREELFSAVETLREAQGRGGHETIRPGAQMSSLIDPLQVRKFGVGPLDDLIEVGVRHSESYLILGPTGGGKTALAIQWSAKYAETHRVYYATFEQSGTVATNPSDPNSPRRSEFAIRVAGPMYGISRSDFAGGVSPKDLSVIQAGESSTWAQNWEVHDYTSAASTEATASVLLQDIRREHEEEEIGMVVIDPLWPLVTNTAGAKGMPMDPAQLRMEALAIGEELNSLCKELGLVIAATHQLSAQAATGPSNRLTTYSSAEVRTLANRLENVIIISKQNEVGQRQLVLAKGRNSGEQGKEVAAHFDGNMNVFRKTQSRGQTYLSGQSNIKIKPGKNP